MGVGGATLTGDGADAVCDGEANILVTTPLFFGFVSVTTTGVGVGVGVGKGSAAMLLLRLLLLLLVWS